MVTNPRQTKMIKSESSKKCTRKNFFSSLVLHISSLKGPLLVPASQAPQSYMRSTGTPVVLISITSPTFAKSACIETCLKKHSGLVNTTNVQPVKNHAQCLCECFRLPSVVSPLSPFLLCKTLKTKETKPIAAIA